MAKPIPRESLNPVVDLDHILYKCGFAADTQAEARWGSDYLSEPYEHWAFGNANTYLNWLLTEVFAKHEWCRMFIGGEGNYRDTIAKTLPSVIQCKGGVTWKYKGNRDSSHKPKYFSELRNYLIERWNVTVVNGRESDDEVSILQWKYTDKSTCIVGVDKDLDNCPGWHFNPKNKTWKYLSLREADLCFRSQCLSGDWGSDYIPGLTGIADKTAAKIIKECDYDLERIDRKTLQLYNSEFGPELGAAVLHDNKNLLWIQREDWKGYNGNLLKQPDDAGK